MFNDLASSEMDLYNKLKRKSFTLTLKENETQETLTHNLINITKGQPVEK